LSGRGNIGGATVEEIATRQPAWTGEVFFDQQMIFDLS